MTGTTFADNSVDGEGGAILNEGELIVTNSTFSDNSASGGGGMSNAGQLTVTNCSFSGNRAGADGGGGILTGRPFYYGPPPGRLTVADSTSAGNADDMPRLELTNTIIANSTSGGDCVARGISTFIDGGHNFIEDDGCGLTDGANGNIVGVDPLLDPAGLADNGGPTETIALLPGSPAIDAGDPEVCANPPVNGLDQRGYVRPGVGSSACSIGAYEYDSPGPVGHCVGDCDGDGEVTIDELLTSVSIALGDNDLAACMACDRNDDLQITIDEIITGVTHALTGCPATPDSLSPPAER